MSRLHFRFTGNQPENRQHMGCSPLLSSIIKGNSPHKAAGIDKISARFLRIAAPILAPSIARLINMSFSTGTFPTR